MNVKKIGINELFMSVQGEGLYTGRPTFFVRTQYCNIGCKWCDTKKSWKKASDKNIKPFDLYSIIKSSVTNQDICFTGGEPLYYLETLVWVVQKLSKVPHGVVTIETSGFTEYKNKKFLLPERKDIIDLKLENVFFSISPKLPSALGKRFVFEEASRMIDFWIDTLPAFARQFKFVVSSLEDIVYTKKLLKEKDVRNANVYLQIEASKMNDKKFIKEVIKACNESMYSVGIQTQKILKVR